MRPSTIVHPLLLAALFLVFLVSKAPAATYYVNIGNASPVAPYTSWSTAATNIQNAVNETINGDLVLVSNGVYQSSGYTAPDGTLTCVVVTNAITVQSANGATTTFINGGHSMRGMYLTNGATLTGFTITNGLATDGGGIMCPSTNALVSNCILVSNQATLGGGVYRGTLTNCTISDNLCPPRAPVAAVLTPLS